MLWDGFGGCLERISLLDFLAQVGESGEDGFDVLVDGFGGLVFFFGPQLGMAGLNVLADYNQRKKEKLNDISDEDKKNKRIWIKRAFGDGLEEHPAKDKNHEEIDGVHRTDGCSDGDGNFVVELEMAFVPEIDVNGYAAAFEVVGKIVWHNLYYSGL